MSYQSISYVPCDVVQARLNDAWMQDSTAGGDELMPFSEWVSMQMAGVQQEILPSQSKKKQVRLTYFQRMVEEDVDEDFTWPKCESSNKYGNLDTIYDAPEITVGRDVVIDINDLTNFCEGNGTTFERTLLAAIDVVERKVATQEAAEAVLLKGSWGALGQSNSLFTAGTAAGQINGSNEFVWQTRIGGTSQTPAPNLPEAWFNLRYALSQIGNNTPAIFGGLTGYQYFGASQVGCCADRGEDLAAALRAYGYSYSFDQRLKNALGSDNKLMAFGPQSLLRLAYVNGRWKDGVPVTYTNGAAWTSFIVSSPRLGIPMDVTINHPCGTEITMAVSTSTKLIARPLDQFQTNDPYFGKNGINAAVITNPS